MSALSLLSMMSGAGGALPAIKIPCAPCTVEQRDRATNTHMSARVREQESARDPEQAVTVAMGTLVCARHAADLLGTIDRGHVAAAVADLTRAVELVADRVDRLGA